MSYYHSRPFLRAVRRNGGHNNNYYNNRQYYQRQAYQAPYSQYPAPWQSDCPFGQNRNYFSFENSAVQRYGNENFRNNQNYTRCNTMQHNPDRNQDRGDSNNNKRKRKQCFRELHLEFRNKKVKINEERPLHLADKNTKISKQEKIELPKCPQIQHNAKFAMIPISKDQTKDKMFISTPLKTDIKTEAFKSPIELTRKNIIPSSTPVKLDKKGTSADEGFNEDLKIDKCSSNLFLPNIDKLSFTRVWLDKPDEEEVNSSSEFADMSLIVNVDDNTLCTSNLLNDMPPEQVKVKPTKSRDIAVVLDTYVFIYNLNVLEKILDLNVEESTIKPVIYMPWVVLRQLDEIKDFGENVQLKRTAQAANKFISVALDTKNPRFIGQNIEEEQEVINLIRPKTEPDDKVIGTFKQATRKFKHVLLTTNSANLRNKAAMDNIQVYTPEEILAKIRSILWEV